MAGISVGVVFTILVLLVCVLAVFSAVTQGKKVKPVVAVAPVAGDCGPAPKGNATDEAAVATAVYLYFNARHDEESGILTIQVNEHTLWHEELNDRL